MGLAIQALQKLKNLVLPFAKIAWNKMCINQHKTETEL